MEKEEHEFKLISEIEEKIFEKLKQKGAKEGFEIVEKTILPIPYGEFAGIVKKVYIKGKAKFDWNEITNVQENI